MRLLLAVCAAAAALLLALLYLSSRDLLEDDAYRFTGI